MKLFKNQLKSFLSEVIQDSLDFYFDRRYMESRVAAHEVSLVRLIVRAQLYKEDSTFSAIYEIYEVLLALKDIDARKVLNKKNLSHWLSRYIKNGSDYINVRNSIVARHKSPSHHASFVPYEATCIDYLSSVNYIVDLVVADKYLSKEDFIKNLERYLGRRDKDER